MVEFSIPAAAEVQFRVYDTKGRLVKQHDAGRFEPGLHHIRWDGRDEQGNGIASGIYLYKLICTTQNKTRTFSKKMTILK
ncbi:T9SS type A sorting domain-containing protein [candidate division KSB1 bacterium]|nr:T9SS type A sorting domain-containing protein [candidate division KSB1 bacterium]